MTFFTDIETALVDALAQSHGVAALANHVGRRSARLPSAPYVIVEPLRIRDWSVKDRSGHELRLSLALAVQGDTPEPLHALIDAAHRALAGRPSFVGGWQLVTLVPLGTRTLAPPARGDTAHGPLWQAAMDYRLRIIATQPE